MEDGCPSLLQVHQHGDQLVREWEPHLSLGALILVVHQVKLHMHAIIVLIVNKVILGARRWIPTCLVQLWAHANVMSMLGGGDMLDPTSN